MSNYAHYGFKAVVTKPYTVDKLRDVIEKVVENNY